MKQRYLEGSTLGRTGLVLTILSVLTSCGSMKTTKPSTGLQPESVLSNNAGTESRKFRKSAYVSTGLGISMLEPDNSQIPTWEVTDSTNSGGQITLGADINRHVSAEFHSADLGSAGVEQTNGPKRGRVNYHLHGVSALWYAGKNRHRQKRQGLTGYGRAGFAMMDNSPVGDAPYRQVHSTQLLFGAGLEYTTRRGLGLRAEYISFDSDAQYAQLGLIYRMQRNQERRSEQKIVSAPAPVQNLPAEIPPVAAVVKAAPIDSDSDGVADAVDRCSGSTSGFVVDKNGCALFEGTIEGVTFFSASERLTPKARKVLNNAARTLAQYPETIVRIMAHTDNQGSAAYNQNLSYRRAKMVAKYLILRGIAKSRLRVFAHGETLPIASNESSQGRAVNRRVELEAIYPDR